MSNMLKDWGCPDNVDKSLSNYRAIYTDLACAGERHSPRGLNITEIRNYIMEFEPYTQICLLDGRNLNLDYLRREFQWYIKGNMNDTSIQKYAKIWENVAEPNTPIHPSCYGHYWFNQPQIRNIVHELVNDVDSRRACWTVLNSIRHYRKDVKDFPCTYGGSFLIRNGKLEHHIHMRSQDAVFGLGNDAPTFFWLQEIVYGLLRSEIPGLLLGNMTLTVDSFHIYERHYDMHMKLMQGGTNHTLVEELKRIPAISPGFSHSVVDYNMATQSTFMEWLMEVEL